MHLFNFAAACNGGGFLGFPKWYKYLDSQTATTNLNGQSISACAPKLDSINDIWLIGAAIVEILIRIAALGAIIMVIWGGVKLSTSQGDPSNVASARNTIFDGLVGLAIAITSIAVITFVAGRF
jgi:hypothetical protein